MDKIRLLVCHDCHSIEELPWYDGPVDYDVLLDHSVAAHRFPNGEEHRGVLMNVEAAWWNNHAAREEIITQIKKQTTGLDHEWYATKNTYAEDAMKCFRAHNRPNQGCIDWEDSKKRLGNPTKIGWQAGPKVYLCSFCPVASWVATEQRYAAGIYKENN